jgi:microcystin-dependent protein
VSDQFVAEIRIVPFQTTPTGWATCDGQLIPISQNTALFSLLGTVYGGNGQSTFALPNLQGSVAMHPGQGAGLSQRVLGETGGSETVTLLQSEMPVHSHRVQGGALNASTTNPSSAASIARGFGGFAYKQAPFDASKAVTMAPQMLSIAGGGLPHTNMMPYLTLKYIIAMQGDFPARP